MKYPVLNDFIEKYHKNTLYKKGEIYPKEGFKADPERVKYLQSEKNKYKIPFLGPEIKENDKEKEVASFEEDEPVEEKEQEEIASLDEHVEESSDEAETDEAGTAKKGCKNNSRKRKPAEK
ncbi:hypothetical protein [Parageobacillus thermoglucosidasius]|uniref:Uncharacterized protein n=1 Tax=Parageobacillus thermoglucosidasius TaxID=1426 RepID=A0A1B7KUL7_PARTM|nr:hypothetical protein [Parageobacillus thermoglucosidasius]OAT73758.1 hypothetical protein A7K69_18030 [Parageobacillus thermoglucosidasius]